MAKTKTSSAVKNRYNAKAYDRLSITVPKGRKADIEEKLKATGGGSVNRLVNDMLMSWYGVGVKEWGYKDE